MSAPAATKKRGRGRISNLAAASQKKLEESGKIGDSGSPHDHAIDKQQPATEEVTFSIDDHPLKIGCHLIVSYRDGSNRVAKIIEHSQNGKKDINGTALWQYYVHYQDFNRRMDEWIPMDRIVSLAPASAIVHHHHKDPSTMKSSVSTGQLSRASSEGMLVVDVISEDHSSTHDSVDVTTASSSPRVSGPATSSTSSSALSPVLAVPVGGLISTVAELDHDEHEGLDEASLLEHEEITKVKNISYVQLGRHVMECWYFSPFPKEYYPGGHIDCLYFCEFSFRFFCTKDELIRYQRRPELPRHPPGNEIYRDGTLSMFELDGAVEKVYCQNLCYFAKLFLDHKTLYWDVDPFLFYVLCTRDERGFHPVGYFSKEKYSDLGYNLACILTFPCVQRMGYGRFLMAFSYELSKKEEKAGSPEKPLSDLGALGYRSYWACVLLRAIKAHLTIAAAATGSSTGASSTALPPPPPLSIMDLSRATSVLAEDVVSTLQMLGLLRHDAASDTHYIYAPPELLESLLRKYPESALTVDPDRLHWAPLYVTDPKKDKWSLKSKRQLTGNSSNSGSSGPAGQGGGSGGSCDNDFEGSVASVSVQ